MEPDLFSFTNKDGITIQCYHWLPINKEIKGIIQISHGMAEKALRYTYFAQKLNEVGIAVYANDHRGHGGSTSSIEELGYISDKDGFHDMVEDMKSLTDMLKKKHPETPIYLFGHSMGSFLSQRYIQLYGKEINGLILSGSNGKQKPIVKLGIVLARFLMLLKGRKAPGKLLDRMAFGKYNQRFEPRRTDFDWLTRDEKEVDLYIDDPACGTLFPVSFFHDFLSGLDGLHKEGWGKDIPKALPIYIFSGEQDPVGDYGKGVFRLYQAYKNLQLEDVTMKLYPEGRHEMLNELNKEEVIEDTIHWIRTHL